MNGKQNKKWTYLRNQKQNFSEKTKTTLYFLFHFLSVFRLFLRASSKKNRFDGFVFEKMILKKTPEYLIFWTKFLYSTKIHPDIVSYPSFRLVHII